MSFAEEIRAVPKQAGSLALDVVIARMMGRALPLRMDEAALLREHGLIDHVSRPTDKCKVVAGEYALGNINKSC